MKPTRTLLHAEQASALMWGQPPRLSSRAQRGLLAATLALLFLLLATSHVLAQDFKVPANVERLSARGRKKPSRPRWTGPMLRWASKFLSAEDPDEARTAKMVSNLKGIYVRSYEFDHDGGYSCADIEEVARANAAP